VSAVALKAADSWGGLDLAVRPAADGPRRPTTGDGLAVVRERENLGQALILRLLTARGSLAPLGHPDYGSRLVELIGRENDETTRNLARLYVLEALRAEPRVREVAELTVETASGSPDTVRVSFGVLPLGDDEPLTLGLEVAL
jgi:phage baseplate assembly protein W